MATRWSFYNENKFTYFETNWHWSCYHRSYQKTAPINPHSLLPTLQLLYTALLDLQLLFFFLINHVMGFPNEDLFYGRFSRFWNHEVFIKTISKAVWSLTRALEFIVEKVSIRFSHTNYIISLILALFVFFSYSDCTEEILIITKLIEKQLGPGIIHKQSAVKEYNILLQFVLTFLYDFVLCCAYALKHNNIQHTENCLNILYLEVLAVFMFKPDNTDGFPLHNGVINLNCKSSFILTVLTRPLWNYHVFHLKDF